MREVTDHILAPHDVVRVEVLDAPGSGNASHLYQISGFNDAARDNTAVVLHFQEGPIKEAGVNGITQETLLAVVIDRLRSFQAGEYACRENQLALEKIEEGLHWLQQRTLRRVRAGTEGTSRKD